MSVLSRADAWHVKITSSGQPTTPIAVREPSLYREPLASASLSLIWATGRPPEVPSTSVIL